MEQELFGGESSAEEEDSSEESSGEPEIEASSPIACAYSVVPISRLG